MIIGDWKLSPEYLHKNITFLSNLNEYHETELRQKFSKLLTQDIIYSFKDDMTIEITHNQNNDVARIQGVWEIENKQLKVTIKNNTPKIYSLEFSDSELTLEGAQNEKIIFSRNN